MEKSSTQKAKFHFFPANHDIQRTDRQAWELEKAKALSHSARIAHRKKRKKEQEALSVVSRTVEMRMPKVVKTGQLDPFVSLSMELNIEDRNLLQGYLVTVPQEFYGTSSSSSLCPVRDVTLGILATNPILLTWAVLFMQHRNALLRNTSPTQDPLLLRRRQQTYKIMGTKVIDQNSVVSEEAMYSLAFSALIENRTGDKLTAQKHLEACLTIKRLRLQKGLTVLSYPMGMLCIPVCIQVGAPRYFRSLDEVRTAGYTLKKLLWCLQDWRFGSTQNQSTTRLPDIPRSIWTGQLSRSYESVQEQKYVLRRHLTRSLLDTSVTGDRLCLGILITLGLATLAFNQHENGATEYLELVAHCFSESDSTPGSENVPVTLLGMMYIAIMSIDRVQSTMINRQCVIDLWQIVETVEILMLAAPSSRVRVKQSLFSWILDDSPNSTTSNPCDHIFQEHIVQDVEVAWLSQRSLGDRISSVDSFAGYLRAKDQGDIKHCPTEPVEALLGHSAGKIPSGPSENVVKISNINRSEESEESKDIRGWQTTILQPVYPQAPPVESISRPPLPSKLSTLTEASFDAVESRPVHNQRSTSAP